MEIGVEDLDFTDGKYDPPQMKVSLDRLTGAEQSVVEKHIGCSLAKMSSGDIGIGDMSTAVAFVMLKRLKLARGEDFTDQQLWKDAALYSVDIVSEEKVPPTKPGDSTPKSPSPATTDSPSPRSEV